jgi:hypothetical protein
MRQTDSYPRRSAILGKSQRLVGAGTGIAGFIFAALMPTAASAQRTPPNPSEIDQRMTEMAALIQKLQARVDTLEERLRSADAQAVSAPQVPSHDSVAPISDPAAAVPTSSSVPTGLLRGTLRGTTVNFLLDAYYGYNFNNPIGRVSLLRAYDASNNAFSLNQADVVLENSADPEHGKRYGLRLDLQFGLATETLQGNTTNELRPDVWRSIFQAYGTYVAPVGKGLTIDFGKWASSLGVEANYTKDQMNYTRSYWFTFLPYYHTGARLNYKFNDVLGVNYWVTNGTQQTEAFNNFKDQLFGLNVQPRKNIAWTVNYYLGQEHPDIQILTSTSGSTFPTLQGIPFEPILNPPKGKLHIMDTYATWQASSKWTFALEGDYVIQRLTTSSPPAHTTGGAAYARYQFTPRMAFAARSEYLSDRGGMFSGSTQRLAETTVTFEQRLADGLLVRQEWRRDFSNHAYFLTDTLGVLKKEQNTATIGLVWWFGGKEGSW